MATNNREYWKNRQRQLNREIQRQEKDFKGRMTRIYQTENEALQKEVSGYFKRFGIKDVVEYRQLLQTMPQSEIDILYRDIDAFTRRWPQYSHLVPIRESIYQLDRLQGLQISVLTKQREIGASTIDEMTRHLNQVSETAYESIKKGISPAEGYNYYNARIAEGFVDRPWCNGKNFSARVWEDTAKIGTEITNAISNGFARGDSFNRISKSVKDLTINKNLYDSMRLVYTEGTYVMAQSSKAAFQEAGFEGYAFRTMQDNRVCPECQMIDGAEFKFADAVPGDNFPPIHPWCRCTYLVVL